MPDAFNWENRIRFGGGAEGDPGISGAERLTAAGLTGTCFFGIIIFDFGLVFLEAFRVGITIGKSSMLSSSRSDSSCELKHSPSTISWFFHWDKGRTSDMSKSPRHLLTLKNGHCVWRGRKMLHVDWNTLRSHSHWFTIKSASTCCEKIQTVLES